MFKKTIVGRGNRLRKKVLGRMVTPPWPTFLFLKYLNRKSLKVWFLTSSLGEEGKEMWESKLPTFCVLFTYNMDAISR